jgi:hypothetical protein
MEHILKTLPEYFAAVEDGSKTFELRKNDRDFRVGDTLLLMECKPKRLFPFSSLMGKCRCTGKSIKVKVTYILEGGVFSLPIGMVIMAIKKLD